jgi:transposase-like protein
VSNNKVIEIKNPEVKSNDLLTDLIRGSAKEMLACAIELELQDFLTKHSDLLATNNKARIVRNGYLPERKITTGIGSIDVKLPRVRDRGDTQNKINFTSNIVPKHLRRSASVEELLPLLYLKGISTNDFQQALQPLLGAKAKNISAGVISKLKANWEQEYIKWNKRDLSNKEYVYWWVDGIYLQARMEEAKNCVLVIVGVTPNGVKELVGLEIGFRESKASWSLLINQLKENGLKTAPKLATGDGSMGFWGAINEAFPSTKHQRCWVHKTANVLEKLPKHLQKQAKRMLQEIWMADTKKNALKAYKKFIGFFKIKYPKAVECLEKDKEKLLTFYDFPAENWQHIRTSNPIESTFATVRHRTYKAKGCFSQTTILTMVFKLCLDAEKRWKKLYGFNRLAEVISGIKFIDGVKVKKQNIKINNSDKAA